MSNEPLFEVSVDVAHRRTIVGGEPLIFHCHHYNTYLQRTIAEDSGLSMRGVLVGAAAEVSHAQLTNLFSAADSTEKRKKIAANLYRFQGFGTFDLTELHADKPSILKTRHSHYELGWEKKFGKAKEPVSLFATGWLAGAASAIYDQPLGHYAVTQTRGTASGDDHCEFHCVPGYSNYDLFESVGVGRLTDHDVRPVSTNNIDYHGIFEAVSGMPLEGDEQGNIPAFGVYLTRHFANYYCRISYEMLRRLITRYGEEGRKAAEPLLVEAGHVCAFNTFGGVMLSTEWDALIKPQCKNKLDWVHGMVAVINTFGWGRWQVTDLSDSAAEFVIHDDYEGVAWEALYDHNEFCVSYLAQGGVAGLMNLIFHGDITSRPELTAEYYRDLFKTDGAFVATPLASRSCGDDVTRFRVERS